MAKNGPVLCSTFSCNSILFLMRRSPGHLSLLYQAPSHSSPCCAGEAFDKVARLLGLEQRPSGGAALEAFAREGNPNRFKFSLPLRMRPNCNFSYAGLKTAVRLAIEAEAPGPPTDENRQVGD
jgi:tRNA A37 threonylcarbamoyltransferase TsaD